VEGPDLARSQLLEKVEEPVVESPVEAVPDKAPAPIETVDEVIEKVEEPGAKKAESPVEAEKPAEAEKPTRGGQRKAPESKEEAIGSLEVEEHLGRRGWM
jgi:hypothetical protein